MTSPEHSDIQQLVKARFDEIDEVERAKLIRFAEYWLRARHLPPTSDEDMVQRACERILVGLEDKDDGRHPQPEDLVDKKAFLSYVRGVIFSAIDTLASRHDPCAPPDEEVDEEALPASATFLAPDKAAELSDLKGQLFAIIRQRAQETAPRLLPTITAWEEVCDHVTRIPAINGRRKYAMDVRQLAQRALEELHWSN